jgi:hypothetical protein
MLFEGLEVRMQRPVDWAEVTKSRAALCRQEFVPCLFWLLEAVCISWLMTLW